MIIGIDASNLRSGGAITHLSELLKEASPEEDKFDQVIVWGEETMLEKLPDASWLVKVHEPLLDKNLIYRLYWQARYSSRLARERNCDLLFVPSGIVLGNFSPVVTMSHNLLPFEWKEIRRYGLSWQMLRNLLLKKVQSYSFKKSSGVIFLSNYAQDTIIKQIGKLRGRTCLIPHGVNKVFEQVPRAQKSISEFNSSFPYRLFYLSTVDMYKHQWNVAEAVCLLASLGYPVELSLGGGANGKALEKLEVVLDRVDPERKLIHYLGPLPYEKLSEYYQKSDLYIFASTCENMPNILLEAMASGLPITCSNRGPMPEVLVNAGVYFDPENIPDIVRALKELIDSPELREKNANASFHFSKAYTWNGCARKTFKFFNDLVGL